MYSIFNNNSVPEACHSSLDLAIDLDLQWSALLLCIVSLQSPKFLAFSSVYALILLITVLKFLFSILPLKCFCTTYKRYTSIHLTSQSTYAIPQFPNLTTFTRGNCWKVSMAFPSLFWQFHLSNDLIFANWHSGGLISMSPTGSYGQNMPLRRMSRNRNSLTEAIFWLFEDSEVMNPFPLVF